ncbi:MAG: hypothetical protein ABW067_06315, partial [Rhizobacter sp.]
YRLLPEVQERVARWLQTVIDPNDEFQRLEYAARERAALLSRPPTPPSGEPTRWASRDVRWST